MPSFRRTAFTLIELLVVITVVAILAAIALPIYSRVQVSAYESKTLSNMRQMGAAVLLYASDNSNQLPGRVTANKWPTLLKPYVQNFAIYSSPIPSVTTGAHQGTYKVTDQTKYFDDSKNITSYIYNGFNDAGAYTDPTYAPRLTALSRPAATILLGIPYPQTGQFYMDFVERNEQDILNTQAFPTLSQYVFCDGSARVLTFLNATVARQQTEPINYGGVYADWYWLVNKP